MSRHTQDPVEGGTKDHRTLPQRTIPLEEAARSCGVSVDTLRRWISQGKVRAYRFGPRLIRVETDDIDAMFDPLGPGVL